MRYFTDLSEANRERAKLWKGNDNFDASYKSNELAGECGEACNVVKKLERERLGAVGSRDTVEHLADELGDILICVDLLAQHYGIDMKPVIVRKFNATSDKVGIAVKMQLDETPL